MGSARLRNYRCYLHSMTQQASAWDSKGKAQMDWMLEAKVKHTEKKSCTKTNKTKMSRADNTWELMLTVLAATHHTRLCFNHLKQDMQQCFSWSPIAPVYIAGSCPLPSAAALRIITPLTGGPAVIRPVPSADHHLSVYPPTCRPFSTLKDSRSPALTPL